MYNPYPTNRFKLITTKFHCLANQTCGNDRTAPHK